MTFIKLTTVDPLSENNTNKEYQISVELAKAVIATIEKHVISTKPIALTEQSKKPYYLFSAPTDKINAFHLPSHTGPGDELEIYDHLTKETYKVTFSEDYLCLCYYKGAPKEHNVQMIKKALSEVYGNAAAQPAPVAAASKSQLVHPQAKSSGNAAGIVAKAVASNLLLHSAPKQVPPSEPAAEASLGATVKK